jgi:hypothetical protein
MQSLRRLVQSDRALTRTGIAVTTLGLALVGVCWGRMATTPLVPLQLDYLASAGMSGITLVLIGLVIVAIAARRAHSRVRESQTTQLLQLLARLESSDAEPQVEAEETDAARESWRPGPSIDLGANVAAALIAALPAGLILVALGWHGAASNSLVSRQLPYLVSAGVGGVLVTAVIGVLLILFLGRRADARADEQFDDVLAAAGRLVDRSTAAPSKPGRRARRDR